MKTHMPLLLAFLFGSVLTLPLLSTSSLSGIPAQTVQVSPTTINYTQVFREDFNGTALNPDIWQVYVNDGTIAVDSGYVTLSQPNAANRFPYVHTKFNPIPPNGNFAIKIGFQYLTVTGHGDGFSVDDRLPANGSPGSWAWQPTIYTLWQGSSLGYVLFDHSGITRYYTQAPHLSYHDIEFRWLDGTDEYYVDGQLVNTVTRDSNVPRPVDLWFGNPVIPPDSTPWTSFKIDYIEVGSLDAPTPFFDLPLNYPGKGASTKDQFLTAWNRCTTAFFDHHQPGKKGAEGDGLLWMFTGITLPGTLNDCTLRKDCYDGHEGYDFDDWACYGNAVYPAAEGEIVVSETGWRDDGYGNRVVIQHGSTGYKTLYGHLATILVSSGSVTPNTQIGTIGATGCPGCGTHLHFNAYYNGKLVDASGWEPAPWYDDPYVKYGNGPASYRLWLYSPRQSTPVNDTLGANLVSASGDVTVSIPPNANGEDYEIVITELAPLALPSQLTGAGHGFVLQARSLLNGEAITGFDKDVSIQVDFNLGDIEGIRANTISLYAWNATLNRWIPLPTSVSLPTAGGHIAAQSSGIAAATTRDMGYIALLGEPYLVYLPVILR
jgi:hypothetical protein